MTARTGMAALIVRLRGLAQAGTADYSVSGTTWWTDDQLEAVLDRHRVDFEFAEVVQYPEFLAEDWVYQDYVVPYQNLETGTSDTNVFRLTDSLGGTIPASDYTIDFNTGRVRFDSDTGGTTTYYARGRSFDLNRAAADVWREKAGFTADKITFQADEQMFKQADWFKHCNTMALMYDSMAGIRSGKMIRKDLA